MSLVSLLLIPGAYTVLVSDGRSVDHSMKPVTDNTPKVFKAASGVIIGVAGWGWPAIASFMTQATTEINQLQLEKQNLETIFPLIRSVSFAVPVDIQGGEYFSFLVAASDKRGDLGLIKGEHNDKVRDVRCQVPMVPTLAIITPWENAQKYYDTVAGQLRTVNILNLKDVESSFQKAYSTIASATELINDTLFFRVVGRRAS
ncbi:MAG: hypothetical protein U1D96_03510 [Eubacteriales bacterium]|nr:hypothetical protein [Eubacteriales bacterium]